MTKLSVSLIRGYQKYISPIFPPTCRYYPSCSHYTIQALEKHGTLKGSAMGFARILRCNPFVEGGYDQVPDYFTLKRNPDSQLPTQELSNEELVDLLLNDYETELVYNEESLATTLSEILSTEKIDNSELSQSYLSEIAEYTEAMGAENHDFQLLKVTGFKDESYRHQGDDSGLDQGLDHADGTYLITHSHLGVLAASNDQLALDLVLTFGVSEQDVRERTPRLLHYLRVLDQMQV